MYLTYNNEHFGKYEYFFEENKIQYEYTTNSRYNMA